MEKEVFYVLGTVNSESLLAIISLSMLFNPELEVVTDVATYLEMEETYAMIKDAGFPVAVLAQPMVYTISKINKTILISPDNYPIIADDLTAMCTKYGISCVGLDGQNLKVYHDYPLKLSE